MAEIIFVSPHLLTPLVKLFLLAAHAIGALSRWHTHQGTKDGNTKCLEAGAAGALVALARALATSRAANGNAAAATAIALAIKYLCRPSGRSKLSEAGAVDALEALRLTVREDPVAVREIQEAIGEINSMVGFLQGKVHSLLG